jgi:hypothetical protein
MAEKKVFELTAEQATKVDTWYKEHPCNEVAKMAKHRALTYSFTGTGLGYIQKVCCSGCQKELDVTDVKTW